jgi:hypothetical protein
VFIGVHPAGGAVPAPAPLHAAQLIGLLGIFWMLPQTFILPFTLNIMCSQVMLMIAAAVAHEAYQMAFRDELTGLPGRRAERAHAAPGAQLCDRHERRRPLQEIQRHPRPRRR